MKEILPFHLLSNREPKGSLLYIFDDIQSLHGYITLSDIEIEILNKNIQDKTQVWSIYRGTDAVFFLHISHDAKKGNKLEKIRKAASKFVAFANVKKQIKELGIINTTEEEDVLITAIEGIVLSIYSFDKYKSNNDKQSLKQISIHNKHITKKSFDRVKATLEGVYIARNLVNEPPNYLTAVQLSLCLKDIAKQSMIKCGIYSKSKIEQLGMGGILAVNKGSIEEPTFTILEHKHPKAKNINKPIILVGKGVVYDTGGLSLKPTPNSMDKMKSDMSGAAVVAGVMHAVGTLELPLHIIALIPATDNRPGMNAYTPGDIITMYSGQTVEVLNTDAEGRMILADALHLAKKYDPQLVIDIATLTGAASAAVGSVAMVGMSNDENAMAMLKKSGEATYERIVELPLWDEYDEMINSPIADMKNVGGATGGAITAGKFLQRFTDYPWIHLDIAGVSFIDSKKDYCPPGGTGFGIRCVIDFLINKI